MTKSIASMSRLAVSEKKALERWKGKASFALEMLAVLWVFLFDKDFGQEILKKD